MRQRLPNVNEILADVKTAVSQSQMSKEASAPALEYTTSLAQGLQKLASRLRGADFDNITCEEVVELGKKLLQ